MRSVRIESSTVRNLDVEEKAPLLNMSIKWLVFPKTKALHSRVKTREVFPFKFWGGSKATRARKTLRDEILPEEAQHNVHRGDQRPRTRQTEAYKARNPRGKTESRFRVHVAGAQKK